MSILLISIVLIAFIYFFFIVGIAIAWFTVPETQLPKTFIPKTKISVIIAVRNEANNIAECVRRILSQNYPNTLFELIVVDDFSDDNTIKILKTIQSEKLKIFSLSDYYSQDIVAHKKKCITLGVQHALGNLIVTTDGDCFASANWLRYIAYTYEQTNAKVIAAPVKILHGNSILEKFQSLDYTGMMALTAVGVYYNFLSLCNGANMAYEKAAFLAVNGFEDIETIASGDDVLLMEKLKSNFPQRLVFIKAKAATIETFAVKGLLNFIHQRIRWTSKSKLYTEISIKVIALLVLLHSISVVFLFIVAFFNIKYLPFAIVIIFLKSLSDLILLATASTFFSNSYLLLYFPLLQIFHILYISSIGILGNIIQSKWKGRKV